MIGRLAFSSACLLGGALAACGSEPASTPTDAGSFSLGDAATSDVGDGGTSKSDATVYPYDGGVLRADRFVTKVVSFTPGDCAGFGSPGLPDIVLGPPVGGGTDQGGLDVVSLGNAGTIVLSFEPNAIVDGPGTDFIVFENPFLVSGKPESVTAELGEVSVSEDGVTWTPFPCTASAYPYGTCAGWHPVFSTPDNGISPVDPSAGGDAFDLQAIGVTRARFVKITDRAGVTCPPNPNKVNTNGFDLDAIAIVNAATP
ncbi:MAG: Cell surface protein [Myxococcaceae bacterium]|nr:Cell surface protein [Myxococcaceae bacterium]